MKVTLGGDRLGSGNKQKVELQDFGRSTHEISNAWRSSMSAGTLVPFMVQPALPGDVWEINLDVDVKTHPTIGPLFGSMKVQLDVFTIPMRLYNSWIHNNKLGIGTQMQNVKMPFYELYTANQDGDSNYLARNNYTMYPINPSHIINYLGVKGVGRITAQNGTDYASREFTGIPLLGYWDIFKNYYANKQETKAYVIKTPKVFNNITNVYGAAWQDQYVNNIETTPLNIIRGNPYKVFVVYTGDHNEWDIKMLAESTYLQSYNDGRILKISDLSVSGMYSYSNSTLFTQQETTNVIIQYNTSLGQWGLLYTFAASFNWNDIEGWNLDATTLYNGRPTLQSFDLTEIDGIREKILTIPGNIAFDIGKYGSDNNIELINATIPKLTGTISMDNVLPLRYNQTGLLCKTYQSDIFNNWLNKEIVSGVGGINEISRVDTSAGYFNIDTLQLAYKVYRMLNQIQVTGGSFDDWQRAVYDHERFASPEIPIYEGGLSKELVFDELFSNANATTPAGNNQPLGTLAGKATMSSKHKGGHINIHVNELSYIMGIVSITPRLDYSQGNDWFTGLKTWNDWHKPHLDQIGFQDLMAEQLAWFGTTNDGHGWETHAIGKQPAWINYMTNYNRTFGNFAIANNEMFMTLNRRYEQNGRVQALEKPLTDATSYIDPSKFNFIFAETNLDSQNYWVQVAQKTTARRKMSAKVMPNL